MIAYELKQILLKYDPEELDDAAQNENADAMYYVGCMYYTGRHKPRDYVMAAQWLEKAAMKNHYHAAYLLGLMYFKGEGVKADARRGFDFIAIASRKGHKEAMDISKRIKLNHSALELNDGIKNFDLKLLEPPPKPLIDPIFKSIKLWLYVAGLVLLLILPIPGIFQVRAILAYFIIGIILLTLKKIDDMY